MTLADARLNAAILACAISAGIHGGLAPEHFEEGLGAGLGFVAATVALAALAVALTYHPTSTLVLVATAAVFVGLLVAYGLALTTGVPVLHPDTEPVDGLAVVTKAVEVVGLVAVLTLLWRHVAARRVSDPERSPSMDRTRASRPIPIAVTAIVAFFSALAALAVSNGHDAHAHDHHAHAATAHSAPATITRTELDLRRDMRKLWEDHITWTRLAIISLTTDSPDTQATVGRLLQNQTDIGNAVKPFYGRAAGNALTRQLRRHIEIAADLIAAAKAGDQAKVADAQTRWARNGDDIAAVLASVNPRHWRLPLMKAELRIHLRLTTAEVLARLQGKWAADVAAYERIHHHALHLSDLLSQGLAAQFPNRFH
jgi:hypothetical protein